MSALKVIDISKPLDEIVGPLLEAATDQGFLFIDGHDFTQEEVDSLYNLSEEYFLTTSQEEKLKYVINSNNIGYTDFSNENLDPIKARDYKEGYNFGNINFIDGTLNQPNSVYSSESECDDYAENAIPPFFQRREQIIKNAARKLHANAREILRLLAISLGIEDINFFVERFRPDEPSGCILRMLRYPLIRENDEDNSFDPTIRAGAHTDYGALTLLFQRQGQQGLQLQLDGTNWMNVEFMPSSHKGSAPPLIVNFGDLMSYWTGGFLRSTIHRVKFSPGETRSSDRYSIVFFVHPEHSTQLIPVPSKYVSRNPHESPQDLLTITALQHLQKRLAETYQRGMAKETIS